LDKQAREKTAMAENRSKSDQYLLRLPPGLRGRLQEAADAQARSLNAEIVERLEGFEMIQLAMKQVQEEKEKLAAQFEATRDALEDQRKVTHQLQHLISMSAEEARRDQSTESQLQAKFNELKAQSMYLEELKAELLELSKERDDLKSEAETLLKEQSDTMQRMMESQQTTAKVLGRIQRVLSKAADGDEEELRKIISAVQVMDEKDDD
jgi:hypothetical protein